MRMYITIILLQNRQVSETAGVACHEFREVRMSMSGSMDELDNRRMLLKWRSERRERRRKVVYFILEKSCSQQYRCRKTWLRRVEHAQCITFRKIPRREGDVAEEAQ